MELTVLLALIEALFAPGWEHKDGRTTPAGKLAGRTGRGAATDRLGLLLMVLSCNRKGWLQLCPGSVDTERGRPAATMARLLGCSPAGGAKVLSRLEKWDAASVYRQETVSGLNARSRVRVLPVARAHGIAVREAPQASDAVFSDLADTASGDLEAAGGAESLVVTGVQGAGVGVEADSADRADTAHHHAFHASVITEVGQAEVSCGFSGEGRGRNRGLPGRACVREEGPLRGEQQEKSPVVEGAKGGRRPVATGPVRIVDGHGESKQQQRERVPLPPQDLRAVLAPVDLVWARLERPAARRLVEAVVRSELKRVEGFAGPANAPKVLADRLARRLSRQLRTGRPIQDPVGWLIARGLPQQQQCGDARCDDRVLLDSGQDCPRCEDRQVDRRAQRNAVAAVVEAAMPDAPEAERRVEVDRQLHERVTARAWARELELERVRARKASAKARAEAAASQAAVPAELVAPDVVPAPRPAADDGAQEQELVLEDLTSDQVRAWRVRAMKDHSLVFDHIDQYGEASARRLFSHQLVNEAQRLAGTHHLVLEHTTWGRA